MPKVFLPVLAAAAFALPLFSHAAPLTVTEAQWLQAGAPVLAYAKQLKLPVDIVVQPQAQPGAVPLAMGFDGGRCKLVLTMRDNPAAEQVLASLPASQRGLMIEAMTAHEIGHCWRYAQGSWHSVPSGFQQPSASASLPPDIQKLSEELGATRLEEAYADLVALAWTKRNHPGDYAQVYGWLHQVRDAQPASHVSHDTLAWLALAADSTVFGGDVATPFEQARAVWDLGLLDAE